MTIQTTRYSPDTCACVIDYTWDDTLTEDNRVHSLKTYINKCPSHISLATDNDRWNAVFEENPRKNKTLQNILDNGPATLYDLVNGSKQLKRTITYSFSWSGTAPNRVLTVSFTGIVLTTNQKNIAQTFLNNQFGAGKVLIV